MAKAIQDSKQNGKKTTAIKGASYYDGVYSKIIAGQNTLPRQHIDERHAAVLPSLYGTVLDIGCGLGEIANLIDNREYVGIDISEVAITYARKHCTNPNASFYQVQFQSYQAYLKFDTVLMLEVLEHITDIQAAVKLATDTARKRIVVTVPRNMPGRAHITPQWSRSMLEDLFGMLSTCYLFGGDNEDLWWLAVKDIE